MLLVSVCRLGQWPDTFRTQYDCLHFGYEESQEKLEELGREDINKYGMYIKFTCTPLTTRFDNVAKLWYGEKSSHHYLPLFFPL